MHAFEYVVGLKAARLLTPVAKPFRRKHDNITDLRLRRLTQMTERVLRLVRHFGNRRVAGQAKVLRRKTHAFTRCRCFQRDYLHHHAIFTSVARTLDAFARATGRAFASTQLTPQTMSDESRRLAILSRVLVLWVEVVNGYSRSKKKGRRMRRPFQDAEIVVAHSAGGSASGSTSGAAGTIAVCFSRSSRISLSRFIATSRIFAIDAPVPAGIKRPTMTFSLRPSS